MLQPPPGPAHPVPPRPNLRCGGVRWPWRLHPIRGEALGVQTLMPALGVGHLLGQRVHLLCDDHHLSDRGIGLMPLLVCVGVVGSPFCPRDGMAILATRELSAHIEWILWVWQLIPLRGYPLCPPCAGPPSRCL